MRLRSDTSMRPISLDGNRRAALSKAVTAVLCSGSGEVLYDWECRSIERRVRLLEQIEQQTVQLSNLLPVGRFDRLEILTSDGRMICELQPNRRLFVHTRKTDGTR